MIISYTKKKDVKENDFFEKGSSTFIFLHLFFQCIFVANAIFSAFSEGGGCSNLANNVIRRKWSD